jgi:hypothetical protein
VSPLTEGILAGVIANALTSILAQALPPTRPDEKQRGSLTSLVESDPPLASILQKAIVAVARNQDLQDPKQTEKLRLFLISPEAEALTRQIYGLFFVAEARAKSEATIRAEFCALLALHLGLTLEKVKTSGQILFDALITGCERTFSRAIDQGVLSAHEAKSTARFRLVLDELRTIRENLEFLQRQPGLDLGEIAAFERSYRKQLVDRHGFITPPHFDMAHKIPIEDICVSPRLVRRTKEEPVKHIEFREFVRGLYRAVVLGNPGGGKSTLAAKLCHDLALPRQRLLGAREITPTLVILRDYGAAKKESGCSIVQFIERTANSHYQLSPPTKAFEYMLLNGRAMVIFDGLDELLDSSTRQEISSDIESFCNLYPSVPVLVTSREVGYEQAPLSEERFLSYRLSPFEEDQVAEYVTKWFRTDTELTLDQRSQKAARFLVESRGVADLRSNPLMLGLMCNIYRGENYIPRNRPDVYEKCSTMLFERWDKGRGLFVPLPIEAHISPAMKYLAYWIYSEEGLQSGVTEDSLVQKAADYLLKVRFENRDEAENAARQFIEFCKGRAWVFTDTGTTKSGESLYQFTHRTFLEYFAAAYIVRSHPTPEQLLGVLLPRIQKREWDVVAQLAFQLQNKQLEGAADALLKSLLNESVSINEASWFTLSFAARSMEFLVPGPQVSRQITVACIERSIAYCCTLIGASRDIVKPIQTLSPSQLVGDCMSATSENLGTVIDSFEKTLSKKITSSSEREAIAAASLALLPMWSIHNSSSRRVAHDFDHVRWREVSERIEASCAHDLAVLAGKSQSLSIAMFNRGSLEIQQLVSNHGACAVFRAARFPMFAKVASTTPAARMLSQTIFESRFRGDIPLEHWMQTLREVSQTFPSLAGPWARAASFEFDDWMLGSLKLEPRAEVTPAPVSPVLPSEELFGAFLLLASLWEARLAGDSAKDLRSRLERLESPSFKKIWPILSARGSGSEEGRVEKALTNCEFNQEQRRLAGAWANGSLNFSDSSNPERSSDPLRGPDDAIYIS